MTADLLGILPDNYSTAISSNFSWSGRFIGSKSQLLFGRNPNLQLRALPTLEEGQGTSVDLCLKVTNNFHMTKIFSKKLSESRKTVPAKVFLQYSTVRIGRQCLQKINFVLWRKVHTLRFKPRKPLAQTLPQALSSIFFSFILGCSNTIWSLQLENLSMHSATMQSSENLPWIKDSVSYGRCQSQSIFGTKFVSSSKAKQKFERELGRNRKRLSLTCILLFSTLSIPVP